MWGTSCRIVRTMMVPPTWREKSRGKEALGISPTIDAIDVGVANNTYSTVGGRAHRWMFV